MSTDQDTLLGIPIMYSVYCEDCNEKLFSHSPSASGIIRLTCWSCKQLQKIDLSAEENPTVKKGSDLINDGSKPIQFGTYNYIDEEDKDDE